MYSDEEKIQLMKDFDKMNYYESQNFDYDDEFASEFVDIVKKLNTGALSVDSDEIKQAILDLEFNLYGLGIFLRKESKFFDEGFEIYLNIGINSDQLTNLIKWLDRFSFEIYSVYEDGFSSLNITFLLKPTYEYEDVNTD